ncbi:hypothetical protein [Fredinandcohnia quinoae]|nr:hypothetical protein [Fredinandcohnia sp. SECRCQ15]
MKKRQHNSSEVRMFTSSKKPSIKKKRKTGGCGCGQRTQKE